MILNLLVGDGLRYDCNVMCAPGGNFLLISEIAVAKIWWTGDEVLRDHLFLGCCDWGATVGPPIRATSNLVVGYDPSLRQQGSVRKFRLMTVLTTARITEEICEKPPSVLRGHPFSWCGVTALQQLGSPLRPSSQYETSHQCLDRGICCLS